MAEPNLKRLRDESVSESESPSPDCTVDSNSFLKRHKPVQSEEDPSEEFQQELSGFDFDFPPEEEIRQETTADSAACSSSDEDDCVNSVMRHLLEASDDELGIPSCSEDNCAETETRYGEQVPFDFGNDGLWEFEDVAAGYYIMMQQSELFM